MQSRLDGKKKGFTIVELSLAIAFIGVLSIIVVLVISNAISAYHRGITLNQINTVGMDLVDDMRKAIQSSPSQLPECDTSNMNYYKGCVEDEGASLIYFVKYLDKNRIQISGKNLDGRGDKVPIYGAFCTGKYSYLWNSGYLFNSDVKINGDSNLGGEMLKLDVMNNNNKLEKSESNFRLRKIEDINREVCKSASKGSNGYLGRNALKDGVTGNKITIKKSYEMKETERLLGGDDKENNNDVRENTRGGGNLALYDLTVGDPAKGMGALSTFYSVSFVLGTVQGGIDVTKSGDYCKAPENSDENFDYCAINKFNFAAQANGG